MSTIGLYPGDMRSDQDADRLRAWVMLLQAQAAVSDAIERDLLDERKLPLSAYQVLFRLQEAPGGQMRMRDLAGSMLLSKSGITRLVDRLEAGGLVSRDSCATDRRVTYATITRKGAKAFADARPVFLEGVRRHFGDAVSDRDVSGMRSALQKVLVANGHAEAWCPAGDEVTEAAS